MLIGVIADDFTGASDIANTLARGTPDTGGLRTAQFLGLPSGPAPAGLEAGVVALKSRSIPAGEAVAQSLAALDWLQAQGCGQIVFKVCSTFDSTPEGNIGPVALALAQRLGVFGVVVCPAFPGAGRTVYQGHLFVQDRLLSESGMQNHPLNPMTDADLRRWLALQGAGKVGHLPWPKVQQGPDAIRAALAAAGQGGETLVIADAIRDEDLVALGRACAEAPLLVGESGIALGLPDNLRAAGLVADGPGAVSLAVDGPGAILAGSCSGATLGQIRRHGESHPLLPIAVDKVMTGETGPGDLVSFLLANTGKAPLAYSSGTPEEVRRAQARFGREVVAERLDRLFAETAVALVAAGIRRLVVAGGETSGAVVSALNLGALTIGPEIDPGVPVVYSGQVPPLALAMKSGNFGAVDFFDKALARMARP